MGNPSPTSLEPMSSSHGGGYFPCWGPRRKTCSTSWALILSCWCSWCWRVVTWGRFTTVTYSPEQMIKQRQKLYLIRTAAARPRERVDEEAAMMLADDDDDGNDSGLSLFSAPLIIISLLFKWWCSCSKIYQRNLRRFGFFSDMFHWIWSENKMGHNHQSWMVNQ